MGDAPLKAERALPAGFGGKKYSETHLVTISGWDPDCGKSIKRALNSRFLSPFHVKEKEDLRDASIGIGSIQLGCTNPLHCANQLVLELGCSDFVKAFDFMMLETGSSARVDSYPLTTLSRSIPDIFESRAHHPLPRGRSTEASRLARKERYKPS
jgi:hypothetical protein